MPRRLQHVLDRQRGGAARALIELALPPRPGNLTASADASAVSLTWDADPDGATNLWKVYAASARDGAFALLATTSTPAYTDATAPSASYRYYHVVGSNEFGDGAASSVTGAHRTAQTTTRRTLAVRGASGPDDWHHTASTSSGFNSGSADLTVGNNAGTPRHIGIRLLNDNPAISTTDSTVVSAKLTLTAKGTANNTQFNGRIQVVKQDNPAAPTTAAEANAFTLTTAATDWDIPAATAWTADQAYDSADFTAAVQEAWSANGLGAGEAMIVVVRDDGSPSGNMRTAYPSDNATASRRPLLTVVYDQVELGDAVAPSAPRNVSVTNTTGGPRLAWDANPEVDVVRYRVLRSTTAGGGYVSLGTSTTASYTDGTAVADTTYYYVVQAEDSVNASLNSSEVSILASTTPPTGDAITLGALTTAVTRRSISYALAYSGDANGSAAVTFEYSKDNGSTWRSTLPGQRHADAYRGSVLFLTPGATGLRVRATVSDADGVIGATTVTSAAITLRSDPVAAATYAQRTHLLASDGSGDWVTFDQAINAANAATSDMVIGVKAGYYAVPSVALSNATARIQFVGQNDPVGTPATDGNGVTDWAPRNETGGVPNLAHAVIYERYTSPSGSGDTASLGAGGWASASVQGAGHAANYVGAVPGPVPSYQYWSRDVGSKKVQQVWISRTSDYAGSAANAKAALPPHLGYWKDDASLDGTTGTLAGWAETARTNLSYQLGAWQDGATTTLYLILPAGVDPNDCYVWMASDQAANSGAPAFVVAGNGKSETEGHVIRGLEFRTTTGLRLNGGADNVYVYKCLFTCAFGVFSPVGSDVDNALIESCHFHGSNVWNETPDEWSMPWRWIKQKFRTAQDQDYAGANRNGQAQETCAIKWFGGRNATVRYCTIDGMFNGIGSKGTDTTPTNGEGIDAHDIYVTHLADDAIEPSGAKRNWRIWNIKGRNLRSCFSTDCEWGPVYYGYAEFGSVGTHGVPPDGRGGADPSNAARAGNGQGIKWGGDKTVPPLCVLFHWTYWSDKTVNKFFSDAIGGAGNERFRVSNCLARCEGYILDDDTGTDFVEDYNFFGTDNTAANGAFKWDGNTKTVAEWRADTASGDHTNLLGATTYAFASDGANPAVAQLDATANIAAPTTGDLRLAAASAFIDKGVVLGNVHDERPYSGTAPDLGATEKA